jgi:hypothetical protein
VTLNCKKLSTGFPSTTAQVRKIAAVGRLRVCLLADAPEAATPTAGPGCRLAVC